MATVVYGDFEWDDAKAETNMRKHGVSFDEAATAFEDPNHLIVDDGSGDGRTYWLLGFSIAGRLLTVVHVERGRRERIISAHRATAEDERRYRQGQGEPSSSPGKRTKADRRKGLAEVARARSTPCGASGSSCPVTTEEVKVGVYDPCTLGWRNGGYWARAAGTRMDNVRGDQP